MTLLTPSFVPDEVVLVREHIRQQYGFLPPDTFVADLVRFVDGKIEVRLNGAEAPILAFTPPDPPALFMRYKHFGFASNVDGATVVDPEICDLTPQRVNRADLLHVVCGGDYFVVEDGDFRLIKAGAFTSTGDVCLVQYHNFVLGFDGAHAQEIDIVANTVVPYVPTVGTLPGALDDPDNPGQKIPGSTNVSIAEVYRDKLWMVYGPDDPQNMIGSKTGDHRDLDTGSADFGHAFGLGTGVANVGQPITCLIRSTRNSLIIGCTNSISELTGDPTTGQAELQEILKDIGISGKDAVCALSRGYMALLTPSGVYLLKDVGNPTPLSSAVLTEGININREAADDYAIQVRADPERQMVYFFLTPRDGAGAATHLAYDERIGDYQVAGPNGLAGGWFPDDYAERFGPTATTPQTFNGHVVWGTRDGYLMVLDDEEDTDDGETVTVKMPLSLLRQVEINREVIARNLLVQPGDDCTVKYRVWGARTAEQLYGYKDGRYELMSGVADNMKVVDPRKVRAPMMYVELYNDTADSSFEVEETDIDITLGRMLTRRNLSAPAEPGEPCRPPLYPPSSSSSSSLTFHTGPGGGTAFSSTSVSTGIVFISSGSPISYSTPPGYTTGTGIVVGSVTTNPDHCTIVGEGEDAHTVCSSTGPQTLGGIPNEGGGTTQTGWTDFSPSVGSRLVYVSASVGDGGGTGSQSNPFSTIAAGYAALRDGLPDHLLLKCGDTFDEPFPDWQKSGQSSTARMVIGSYGTGARPLVRTGTAAGLSIRGLTGNDRRSLALVGIELWAHTNDGSSDAAGVTLTAGGGAVDDIIVEDCYIHQYRYNIAGQGIETRLSNIQVRRSVITDALDASAAHRATGILFGQTDTLLVEENVFDHNGWSETITGNPATQQSHNVYINPDNTTGVITRGNISARAAASGLRTGGATCERNVLLANPIGIVLGPDTQTVQQNLLLDSHDIVSDLRGLGMDGAIGANAVITDNVIAHQTTGTGNTRGISIGGVYTGLRLHHNVIYSWIQGANNQAPGIFLAGSPASDAQVYNNDIQQVGGACIQYPVGITGHTFANNRYWSDNSTPFIGPVSSIGYAAWVTASGETGSSFSAVSYPHASRTVATYMASLGLTATLAAYLAACRAQSRATWDERFTADSLNDYIRAGFGLAAV